LPLLGEKLSADSSSIDPFKAKMQQVMEKEGLTLKQLYNSDETELYYRMMPAKTLASKFEKGAEGRKNKNHVTLIACSNATGNHKLPLVVIGKSSNSRCFKHINNKSALPVHYCGQKNE